MPDEPTPASDAPASDSPTREATSRDAPARRPRRSRRRRIAIWTAAAFSALCLGFAAFAAIAFQRAHLDTVGEVAFERPLRIPPLADTRIDGDGRRVFELELRRGSAELRPGTRTETYGIDGDVLGPTLRARRGEQVRVEVRNRLGEPSTLHWHGMHLPAEMDGGPHQLIGDGATWAPEWRIDQPAATLWYHPHLHGRTAEQVYRGMAGVFIVDDPGGAPRGLPSRYGVDDFPLIVQDKRIGDDGELDTSEGPFSPSGIVGDQLLVNGTPGPYLEVAHERVRLRLLNGSNARPYDLGFADGRAFYLVATDGGLLERPHRTTRVALTPGERAEIVVALRAGERAVLRSFPKALGMDVWNRRFSGADDALDLLELRAARTLESAPPPARTLAELPAPRVPADAPTRSFELTSASTIDDRSMEMERIDFAVERDRREVWEVRNSHGLFHSFHVHGVQFRVLEVDGAPPPPELAGLKDTVTLEPDQEMRLLVRMRDHSDPNLPLMFHCHLLSHEDRGMMGQFVVVEPGGEPGTVPDRAHRHDE
ncbi:multicopper oxidase family protein [Conexibacter arvalis]|uniref:FtsP/CotA-like multicopper oxidase with cupredoxin domain n=1 Tax=Conexibacter arvalis TaxID=912552 RepID=A0A840IFD7_9ACTN|nr:multicopper oxidase domain-containing protein [Conexibacter arvalis]MBB4663727.1 FtsP/CotA-like multicopper oxidase with cupredoxin domain [Conexibacter arvalis]